jgi:hypothetical protein
VTSARTEDKRGVLAMSQANSRDHFTTVDGDERPIRSAPQVGGLLLASEGLTGSGVCCQDEGK